jgi:hypothetical protein
MKFLVLGSLAVFALAVVFFGGIEVMGSAFDLWLNPWLRNAVFGWDWYNVFTNHWSTLMYLRYGLSGLIIPVMVPSLMAMLVFVLRS